MTKVRIKRVGVLKFGIFNLIYGAIIGFIIGILIWLFSGFIPSSASAFTETSFLLGFGWFNIILSPLMYGISGFVGGLIVALIINLTFKIMKGVDIELEEVEESEEPKKEEAKKPVPEKKASVPTPNQPKKNVNKPVSKVPSPPKLP